LTVVDELDFLLVNLGGTPIVRSLAGTIALSLCGFAILIAVWAIASSFTYPLLLPSPLLTLDAAVALARDGILLPSMAISAARILGGWALGAVIGIPLGLMMGLFPTVRAFATPYIQGLRYIPPIAFVGLFVVWFGAGELSKVMLVFYTAFFIVVINTMVGALSTPVGLLHAARCLGTSEHQTLVRVVLPCTVPYIVTGLRMALGNAFIVIAAAEMLAANSGMGFLIWSSRSLMLTDQIFVGFVILGMMGFAADRLLRFSTAKLFPFHRIV
jgi:ABC-type nitrate/sulfonate/bicarbonate transport system permease component